MPINLKRALAAAVLTAAALGASLSASAVPAQAAPTDLAIEFTISDGEAPEGFLFYDPNCPPDIICKPRRVQAFVTFIVSTNVSLASQPLTVQFETFNGTAIGGIDYCTTSGTVTFQPGVFSQAVKVCVKFNTAIEPTENFYVRLKNPSVPAGVSDVGEGTIYDGLEVL